MLDKLIIWWFNDYVRPPRRDQVKLIRLSNPDPEFTKIQGVALKTTGTHSAANGHRLLHFSIKSPMQNGQWACLPIGTKTSVLFGRAIKNYTNTRDSRVCWRELLRLRDEPTVGESSTIDYDGNFVKIHETFEPFRLTKQEGGSWLRKREGQ